MSGDPTLFFMFALMGAGKSTSAKTLAAEHDATLFCQDDLLRSHYSSEISDLAAMWIGRAA